MKMTGIVFYAQPPTSCPEPAGQGVTASCFGGAKVLRCLRLDLIFPGIGDKVEISSRLPMHHGGLNMKHKTVSTIAAILRGGFLALVASITACSQEQRTTIHIEGTIADDQRNAMNGVSAYVTFSRRRAENRYSE